MREVDARTEKRPGGGSGGRRFANASLTDRGLLRAVLVAFVLLLVYRFLGAVVTSVLVIWVGVLLAVLLSGPVEALHRWKVPRPVSSVSILVGAMGVLALGGYLLLPSLAEQVTQLAFTLPEALSWVSEQLQQLAYAFGVSLGGSPSLDLVLLDGQRHGRGIRAVR